ncbi:MAG TPA: response regulator transcription factor [Desulfobacteraceae bacterium]|nr:response regulator transcription factor [Desulfobacteraceae bacterium]HPJ68827.1 response regulator transcription factor [Desulfobacteraceae bacterium]HPQ26899.1 response regulator transcription factor [Desulfobacteraceae bacterium]
MAIKVLIVDDSQKLRELLSEYLMMSGMEVVSLEDGAFVLETIASCRPDVVILDIIMPGKDGYLVLKDIRERFSLPIIMLTARGEDSDKIVGLELGADDYLSKPFNPRELEARIKAVNRTYQAGKIKENTGKHNELSIDRDRSIKIGDYLLNSFDYTLSYKDRKTELSAMEFKIMVALMRRANRIFSRDELMNISGGPNNFVCDRSIDAHISRIRLKIKAIGGNQETVKTVRGIGYMYVDKNN